MQLSIQYQFLPKVPTVRTAAVMDHFGIDFEQGTHVIAKDLEIPLQPGQLVLFTGASGSGKSSIMRQLASELTATGQRVLPLDQLTPAIQPLIDALPLPVEEAMNLLANCGLGEAQLMLRTPQELSEGQRYRFLLALALSRKPDWIVADEYTATLDRNLARVISFNLRRLVDRLGIGLLLATTHQDVIADLAPDLHVQCNLDQSIQLAGSAAPAATSALPEHRKKKERSPLPTASGFPPRPAATGRISLGGITAAIISE